MKLLTKVKIINWHYFWDETIEIKPIVFLTGVNGSGKSTLIDALQVVLLGDTSGRYFNKAAMEKSSRTLKGYLRGELGDTIEGGFKYLRNGRFTSYIALEYFDDVNNVPFTLGVVFDSYEDGSEDHHFFSLEDVIPENNFVLDRVPMEYKTLNHFFQEQYPNKYLFFDSNKQYQEFIKRKFGGLKDKYFSLLKKATSFTPITDITTFITQYVCDPQANIELDVLQDNITQYKKLQIEALNIEKRVKRLEEIQNSFDVYARQKDNFKISQYIIERCQLEQSLQRIKNFHKQIERNNKRIEEIEAEILEFDADIHSLEEKKTALISDRASNDNVRMAQRLKEEKENAEKRLKEISRNVELVRTTLKSYADSFLVCSRDVVNAFKNINLNNLDEEFSEEVDNFITVAKQTCNVCVDFRNELISDISKIDKDKVLEFRQNLTLYKTSVGSLSLYLSRLISKIAKEIKEINQQALDIKKGTKPYDSRLIMIKDRLEKRLEERFSKHINVEIFADLIDIDDLSWSDAIEGLLNPQKFNLFVAPAYYNDAYKILRSLLSEFGYYRTALVDDSKIIERGFEAQDGSLAEEILTNHEGARAYADFLLGRVHKAFDIEDARKSGNGITKECDLYRNFALTKMNPQLYRESYIGKNLGERFANENAASLKEKEALLEIYRQIEGIFAQSNQLQVYTTTEVDNMFFLLKDVGDIQGLQNTISYFENELNDNDTTLTRSIDNRLNDIEEDIKQVNKSKEAIILEKGNLIHDNEIIKNERIVSEQKEVEIKENSIDSKYDSILVSEKALPLFLEMQEKGKSTYEIFQTFNVEFSRLQYTVNNIYNQVVRLRREYTSDYHLSYDINLENNDIYEAELKEFRDVKLPEYKDKIVDSYEKATKQFKDDFIFKLRSAIEDVEDQIDNLNDALKQSSFGRDLYRFTVKPSVIYRRYYDMLKDDLVISSGEDDSEFVNKYKDVMEDLFRQIVDVGESENNSRLQENILKFTDYRNYLDFDLIMYNKDTGDEQRLSKMMKKKSGGETQTPFYIAVVASFAQLYHVNDDGELGNTSRLIIFDEAFSKMDRTRMTEAVRLLRKFNLQVILSAPYDKIPDISPLVDETLIVLRDKNRSCVRLFEKEASKWGDNLWPIKSLQWFLPVVKGQG